MASVITETTIEPQTSTVTLQARPDTPEKVQEQETAVEQPKEKLEQPKVETPEEPKGKKTPEQAKVENVKENPVENKFKVRRVINEEGGNTTALVSHRQRNIFTNSSVLTLPPNLEPRREARASLAL